MKQSRYNFFFPVDNGKYLAFNALKNGLALVEGATIRQIEAVKPGEPLTFKDNLLAELMRGGFIIEDDYDEYGLISVRKHMQQYAFNHLSLTVAPTLDCNLRCRYCYETPRTATMSAEASRELVKFIKTHIDSGIKRLNTCWYGGEPLMAFDLIEQISTEIMSLCEKKEVQYYSAIITNGSLLDQEKALKLKSLKVGFAQVTIDGPKEIHDRRRPYISGQGSFDDIVSGIRQAAGIIPISLRINIDSSNLEEAGRIVDVFKGEEWFTENLKKALISVYYGHVRQYTSSCRCDKEEVLKDGDFWSKEMELRRYLKGLGLQSERYPDVVSGCTATSSHSYVVDPQGNLYKCWNHLGIQGQSVGSIFKPVELNALHIAYLTEGFERDGECLDCRFLPICMGGCVDIRVKVKRGEFSGKNCSQWKYFLEECLRDVYISSLSGPRIP